jgi:glycosyltransferase involved in cell wall biosynthesis
VKIALLTPGGVDRSGRFRVIPVFLWLIERLAREGHEVHVFVPRQESEPGRWQLLGATVHNAGRWPHGPRLLWRIAEEHRRGAFDVIHALWANGPGVLGTIAARLLRVPLVLSLPGGDVADHREIAYGGLSTTRGRFALRFAVAGADAVNTPSAWMAGLAARAGIRADVIALGVALDRWPPTGLRQRREGEPIRLLHVANLNRVKDQPTLLRAMALLKRRGVPFTLEIAGFDALAGEVQRFAAGLGLQAEVAFLGFVPHDQLRPLFDRADVLVVSSIHEAGPLVTLEAAIAGVPTIGTQVGHIADFAPEAAVGVPIGDVAALADAIGQLAADEPRRLRIAAAAQERALRLDADHTCREILRVYRAVARSRATRSSEAEISSRV